jgi:hypothetical protein
MTIADLVTRHPIISLAVFLSMAAAATQPSKAAITGNGYWQETRSGNNCGATTICEIEFSAVPAGKQVTVLNVSCSLRINGTQPVREMKLGSENSNGVQQTTYTYLTPMLNGVSGSLHYYAVNNNGMHILRSGEKANITLLFDTQAAFTFSCTLGGRLLTN